MAKKKNIIKTAAAVLVLGIVMLPTTAHATAGTAEDGADVIVGTTENEEPVVVNEGAEDLKIEFLVQEWNPSTENIDPSEWRPVENLTLEPDTAYILAVKCENIGETTYKGISVALQVPNAFEKSEVRELTGILATEAPVSFNELKLTLGTKAPLELALAAVEKGSAEEIAQNSLITLGQHGDESYHFIHMPPVVVLDNGEEARSFTMSSLTDANIAPQEQVIATYLLNATATSVSMSFGDVAMIIVIIAIVGGFAVAMVVKIRRNRQRQRESRW